MKISIQHDGTFDIATGRSRKETNWKNREMSWKDLVQKLSVTHRTAETHTEYVASKKTRQDEIKDIGGFVGGYLSGGRRKERSVMHRQLVTLDLDFAKMDLWDDFTMLYGNASCIYSTHKHSIDAPRFRLILPLDRTVVADEYEAIARRIAGVLGIDYFDHTTFQPSRLMYWPSTSKDGDWFFNYQDGEWLSADDILASYRDWTDSSEWPVSTRESAIIKKGILKQGDPLEKPGVVGAWCRTYSIHEAIEQFLPDVYEPCDMDDRYTYKEGSTAAGLVIYDDKYAFSHHGTDPISGKLCNAFDLVRLHKFGLQDDDVREGTPSNKLPSYVAMQEYASKDVKVKKQRGSEILDEAKSDFFEVPEEAPEDNGDWMAQLDIDKKGNIYSTIDNIAIILMNDPAFKNNIAFDGFENRAVATRNLPWRKVDHKSRFLIDRDDDNLEHYLEKAYKITSTNKLEKALSVVYERNLFHPIRNSLNGITWDGEERVDNLMIDYMGAEDSAYVKAVTRKTLVAAVARVFQPGVKFDYVLTLIGDQGKRKSSLLKKLGKDWFTDTFNLHMLQGKEGYEQIRGVWLVEIGEMAGMAKAEVERIKGFISAQEDRYRMAYGRRVENYPRQCVFFGTTNKPDFLRDQTGNRRFWPVQINPDEAIKNVFKDLTDIEIDQVWAEAVELYRKGESLYLPDALEKIAISVQKEHTEEHPWTGLIQQYLDTKVPDSWHKMNRYERLAYLQGDELQAEGNRYQDRICVLELWSEALARREAIDEKSAAVIRSIMRNMDCWKEEPRVMRYGIYGVQRKGFFRTEVPKPIMEDTVTGVLHSRYNV
jgi:putative DNA primase/helicase